MMLASAAELAGVKYNLQLVHSFLGNLQNNQRSINANIVTVWDPTHCDCYGIIRRNRFTQMHSATTRPGAAEAAHTSVAKLPSQERPRAAISITSIDGKAQGTH
eukprot:6213479-Pleurochrysis_carterae.AAC.3